MSHRFRDEWLARLTAELGVKPERVEAIRATAAPFLSQALVEAGSYYIQIDEPAIHTRPEEDFEMAAEEAA